MRYHYLLLDYDDNCNSVRKKNTKYCSPKYFVHFIYEFKRVMTREKGDFCT